MQNTAQSGCFCWGCIHGGSQLSWGAGAGSGGASGAACGKVLGTLAHPVSIRAAEEANGAERSRMAVTCG